MSSFEHPTSRDNKAVDHGLNAGGKSRERKSEWSDKDEARRAEVRRVDAELVSALARWTSLV